MSVLYRWFMCVHVSCVYGIGVVIMVYLCCVCSSWVVCVSVVIVWHIYGVSGVCFVYGVVYLWCMCVSYVLCVANCGIEVHYTYKM